MASASDEAMQLIPRWNQAGVEMIEVVENQELRVRNDNMILIPGGTFRMGSDRHYPEEAPSHNVRVGGFWIDRYAVSNSDFRRFVEATGYITLAERPVNPDDYPGAKPELLVPSSV